MKTSKNKRVLSLDKIQISKLENIHVINGKGCGNPPLTRDAPGCVDTTKTNPIQGTGNGG
ncbi:hypothetical protein [Aquimarina sp. AU119]|uniref:hypothetical protein n=1 Tax=Aquimarina sp. AU119 TaxID=2108528 RepID=UPI000D6A042C|nr:hypothetical protein [Aquimarina sp. AU119]